MTVNTLQFLRDEETKRANLAAEQLKARALEHDQAVLSETNRHNLTTEAETSRSNKVREFFDRAEYDLAVKQYETQEKRTRAEIDKIETQIRSLNQEMEHANDKHALELEIKELSAEKTRLENIITRAENGDVKAIQDLIYGEAGPNKENSATERIGQAILNPGAETYELFYDLLTDPRSFTEGIVNDVSAHAQTLSRLLGSFGGSIKLFK